MVEGKTMLGMSVLQSQDGGYIVAGRTASFDKGGDDIWLLNVTSWEKSNGTRPSAEKRMMPAFRL